MNKAFDDLTLMDFISNPKVYNLLIKACSNRYFDLFLSEVLEDELIADIGCGPKTIVPEGYRVVRCDFNSRLKPEIVCSASVLPLRNCSVNHVVCAWMLEHIEEPSLAINDMHRIMKPGGCIYLSAQFNWQAHEAPRDFFRFTEYGLRYLFSHYGDWDILHLKPSTGFWLTISQILNYKFKRMFPHAYPPFTILSGMAGFVLERISKQDSLFCNGYCVIARKR